MFLLEYHRNVFTLYNFKDPISSVSQLCKGKPLVRYRHHAPLLDLRPQVTSVGPLFILGFTVVLTSPSLSQGSRPYRLSSLDPTPDYVRSRTPTLVR